MIQNLLVFTAGVLKSVSENWQPVEGVASVDSPADHKNCAGEPCGIKHDRTEWIPENVSHENTLGCTLNYHIEACFSNIIIRINVPRHRPHHTGDYATLKAARL